MSRTFNTLRDFAAFLEGRAIAIEVTVQRELPQRAARILHEHADRVFGDPAKLAPDAPATQAERARLGYTINEPLLRTGALRASLREIVDDGVGGIASDARVMAYQEYGFLDRRTGTVVPPRPVFATALRESAAEIETAMHEALDRVFSESGEE